MPEKRTLTIGVTINLGNYESLRMEVSGDVEGENGAAELSEYLDTVLSGYGKGDEQIGQAINKYRKNVLTHKVIVPIEMYPENDDLLSPSIPEPVIEEPKIPEPIAETSIEPEPAAIPEPVVEISIEPEPVAIKEPVVEISIEPESTVILEPTIEISIEPKPVVMPEPIIEIPDDISTEPQINFICEKCGAEVSKVQRDVSNLFMGKTLCKTCMK